MDNAKKPILQVIEGSKEDLEVELVEKLKQSTINKEEIMTLISRINVRRGHLKDVTKETLN